MYYPPSSSTLCSSTLHHHILRQIPQYHILNSRRSAHRFLHSSLYNTCPIGAILMRCFKPNLRTTVYAASWTGKRYERKN